MKEDIFPRKASTISGSDTGWKVEARVSDYKEPIELLGGQKIGHKWRELEMYPAEPGTGVISKRSYTGTLEYYHLLSYAAAQSLRWAVHSAYEATDLTGMGLETRLVQFDVTYSMSATAVSAHLHVHGEDRSNILPDWNKAKLEKDAKAEEKQRHIASLENIIARRNSELPDFTNISKAQLERHKLIQAAFEYELEELKKSS